MPRSHLLEKAHLFRQKSVKNIFHANSRSEVSQENQYIIITDDYSKYYYQYCALLSDQAIDKVFTQKI